MQHGLRRVRGRELLAAGVEGKRSDRPFVAANRLDRADRSGVRQREARYRAVASAYRNAPTVRAHRETHRCACRILGQRQLVGTTKYL